MIPAQVVRRAADYLERHDVQSARATAELLLASVLETDRNGLYARTRPLDHEEARAFGQALCRRCAGTPTQHLTGLEGFRRLTLTVRPGVFIPRPETEGLVDLVLAAIAGRDAPLVIDVGTGTGAIALAVADEHPGARVVATDVSAEAVRLARENAAVAGVTIEVVQGPFLEPVDPVNRGAVDVLVSNPPYVRQEEYPSLPPEVRADPRAALVGGIEVYMRLFSDAGEWLRAGGVVAVEIGERQADEVSSVARDAGLTRVEVGTDLGGRDRHVTAMRP